MDSPQSLAIKYNPIFPALLLASSLIMLWASVLTGSIANTALAILFMLLSVLMFTRPIVVLNADGVEQRNLVGRVVKSFPFRTHAPSIRDNALYCGGSKICPQWMINTQLSAVEQFLKTLGPRTTP